MNILIILTSVLCTAIISGIVGMAGGLILMAILVTLLPIQSAMILHGLVQAWSNGARFWILRSHMSWSIVPLYCIGALVPITIFMSITFIPEPGVVLVLIGLFPVLSQTIPRLGGFDITRPSTSLICGASVTTTQLLAGASGPILDVFYVNSPLNRYQIIATKAFTQTLGHIVKCAYYIMIVASADFSISRNTDLSVGILFFSVLMAILGARIGTYFLRYVNEEQFTKLTRKIILILGLLCIAKGGSDLIQA